VIRKTFSHGLALLSQTYPAPYVTDTDMTGGEGTIDLVNDMGEDIRDQRQRRHWASNPLTIETSVTNYFARRGLRTNSRSQIFKAILLINALNS